MLTEDYMNRFSGIGRLYGKNALQTFHDAHVMVIGLGGVGSWTAEALVRSGIGTLTLVDLDDICITNTNRQIPAHEGNIGKMKVEALAQRLRLINPDCTVHTELTFYSERNAETLLSGGASVIIDAIDSVKAKCHLLAECNKRNLHVISCGGAGGKIDLTRVSVADLSRTTGDKLASSVRSILRKDYGFPSGDGKKPKKFGIPTVFSDEPMTAPQPCSLEESVQAEENTPRNLNCATGYGAVTHVTGTFGFLLAQLTLGELKKSTDNKKSA